MIRTSSEIIRSYGYISINNNIWKLVCGDHSYVCEYHDDDGVVTAIISLMLRTIERIENENK